MHSPPTPIAVQPVNTRRLLAYFGLVYFCQGVTAYSALLNQPLRNYLKNQLQYDAERTSAFIFVAAMPWTLKPLYGLLSDFIPLLGYRRRSYLLLFTLVTAVTFLWMSGVREPRALLLAMFLVGVGVAAADVIVDALMVETGAATGKVRTFQGVQWICVSTASMLSALLAGWIIAGRTPGAALGLAALIASAMPLIIASFTFWAVKEQKTRLNLAQMKATAGGLLAALTSLRLWGVLIFLSLLAANPALITPMYYHLTNKVGLPAEFMPRTDMAASFGYVIGAAFFLFFLTGRVSMRTSLVVGILTAAVTMTPFFFVTGKTSAIVANIIYGTGYMIGNLAMLSLAAQACPKRAEGFVFAAMMAVLNLANNYSDLWGSALYEGRFARNITPLLWISIGLTLVTLPFVPLVTRKPVTAMT